MQIFYRDGYKYQLAAMYCVRTGIKSPDAIISDFLCMTADGDLTICSGYAWDGPSGPVVDVKEFMRASLVHDALYQLMREEMLPQSCKKRADRLMKRICIEDGMSYPLAEIAYQGVDHFGYSHCKQQMPVVRSAP